MEKGSETLGVGGKEPKEAGQTEQCHLQREKGCKGKGATALASQDVCRTQNAGNDHPTDLLLTHSDEPLGNMLACVCNIWPQIHKHPA